MAHDLPSARPPRAGTLLQHTLARPFRIHGVGLRTGETVCAELRPAAAHSGRTFIVGDIRVPATVDHVVDTRLATTLGIGAARVSMVEHLCAALYACGVDNVDIHVEGTEIPVLDGSSRAWVEAIGNAGLTPQPAARRSIVVRSTVRVELGDGWAEMVPAPEFQLDLSVDFPHPCIGHQRYVGAATGLAFQRDVAWARTFGFLRDAEALRAAGLALGASLDNTVVYDTTSVLNPSGLRHPEEAVRHKALDAVGDASLVGAVIRGRMRAHRAGHALHVALFRALAEVRTPAEEHAGAET